MIPFNYLGPVFERYASVMYPQEFKKAILVLSKQIDKKQLTRE